MTDQGAEWEMTMIQSLNHAFPGLLKKVWEQRIPNNFRTQNHRINKVTLGLPEVSASAQRNW
jgi:hypothetical protein